MKEVLTVKKDGVIDPTLVIGLPGIGNVGKIVIDYLVDHLKAKEIGKFYIDTPPMVFPTQEGIEFPSVKLYHALLNKDSFLFITGDYQPRDSKCFDFCKKILGVFKKLNGKEIIILGGASLPDTLSDPSVYAISSNMALIDKYMKKDTKLQSAHGNLGPIVGVAGVMLGLAKESNIDATAFLTETTDKDYFNTKSVRRALNLLTKLTGIDVNVKKFDSRIKSMDAEISAIQNIVAEDKGLEQFQVVEGREDNTKKVGYIG